MCFISNFLPGKLSNFSDVYKWECWCNLSILRYSDIWLKAPAFNIAELGSYKYFLGSAKVGMEFKGYEKLNCCFSDLE